ncbi:MAG TPA: GatB/YqeY domain-containing protein [Candidatus Pseudogracilibacillus intestinigallinarum]|uniref:GatB/YqeY domain-containing protein n=1 Tax=Candidatus Pseudogracilibacillus intestinigallinarum TaxID=2838742 RepID=A0A9D1PJM9_9BACI|nr:GatB/YqeY domain-containing protein [Candidatus Pseudogracilibacillus intestinigallinarum]
MSLLEQLNENMKQAMRAKDKERLSVIRMVKASLQNEAIKLGVETLSEEDEITVLSRELKQRRDSMKEFEAANRIDLAEKLASEIEMLQPYLPAQLSETEVEQLVQETIKQVGATSKKDFGKVMQQLMPKVKGKADGSVVQQLVQKHLA